MIPLNWPKTEPFLLPTRSENKVSEFLNPLVVRFETFWLIDANAALCPFSAVILGIYR